MTPPSRSHKAPPSSDARLLTALVQLRSALKAAEVPLDLPGSEDARTSRAAMLEQLDDYVIPRLATLDAPLLAVVGGSTGAGKSTLVNALVGHRVTTAGVLRPTTRSPVIAHHPDDAQWFGQDRLLPSLVRVEHTTDDPDSLQLVPTPAVPRGLAILDAPDVDSVEERNRILAGQLLAAADLWLFVTSAARYADQVPWGYLKQAAERSTAVAMVLDRTPDDAIHTVSTHLARMLASRGLKDSPLFVVTEGTIDDDGLLPTHHVAEIREWLEVLADDVDARTLVVRRTLDGAVRNVAHRCYPVADAAEEQLGVAVTLRDAVDDVYDRATEAAVEATCDGTLLRGEVLARWQEFVGSGELLRSLDTRVGGLRDRLVNTIKGKPQQAERLSIAVESAVEALVVDHAERAAEQAHAAWSEHPAGGPLLAGPGPAGPASRGAGPTGTAGELGRASRDLRRRTEQTVRAWQHDVAELVRVEGHDKRTTARFLALGVQGLTVALTVVVFAHDGPPHDAPGHSAAAGRKLLEAVFGDQVVRTLTERARQSLRDRVGGLVSGERARYHGLVDALTLRPTAADDVRDAARRIDDLRFEATRARTATEPAGDLLDATLGTSGPTGTAGTTGSTGTTEGEA